MDYERCNYFACMDAKIESLLLELLRIESLIFAYADLTLEEDDHHDFHKAFLAHYKAAVKANRELYPEMFTDDPL